MRDATVIVTAAALDSFLYNLYLSAARLLSTRHEIKVQHETHLQQADL